MSIFHQTYHFCCHDCCNFKRHHPNNPVKCSNFFFGFFAVKLILEVFGAAGAVWGSSDGEVLVDLQMRNSGPLNPAAADDLLVDFSICNKLLTSCDSYLQYWVLENQHPSQLKHTPQTTSHD